MRPNFVLIVLDTARERTFRDLLRKHSIPRVSEIAQEGTVFTSAHANGAWTLPTHASIFTGKRVNEHGTNARSDQFTPGTPSISELLSEEGYRTCGISGNTWISPLFNFDRGFDLFSMKWDYFWEAADLTSVLEYDDWRDIIESIVTDIGVRNAPVTVLNSLYANFLANRHDDGAKSTTGRITKWIRNSGINSQPFFVFINYFEPHLEYDPAPEVRRRFVDDGESSRIQSLNQDPWEYLADQSNLSESDFELLKQLYRAEIAYLDDKIGKIYHTLQDEGILDNTCLIIVGDHGENIGDHGLMDHQYCLYETLLNVPLIIRYPDAFPEGIKDDSKIETRDIFPTILELAEVGLPNDSAISDNRLDITPERDFLISEYRAPQPSMESIESRFGHVPEQFRRYDRALRSIQKNHWKLIEGSDGSTELYNVAEDPDENVDRSDEQYEIVQQLSTTLDEEGIPLDVPTGERSEIDRKSRKRLEDLGYL